MFILQVWEMQVLLHTLFLFLALSYTSWNPLLVAIQREWTIIIVLSCHCSLVPVHVYFASYVCSDRNSNM